MSAGQDIVTDFCGRGTADDEVRTDRFLVARRAMTFLYDFLDAVGGSYTVVEVQALPSLLSSPTATSVWVFYSLGTPLNRQYDSSVGPLSVASARNVIARSAPLPSPFHGFSPIGKYLMK